jgi:hypothetical protein
VSELKTQASPVADLADAVLAQAAEVNRLRGVIRAAAFFVATRSGEDPELVCPLCHATTMGLTDHKDDCPWPALAAEAEKS